MAGGSLWASSQALPRSPTFSGLGNGTLGVGSATDLLGPGMGSISAAGVVGQFVVQAKRPHHRDRKLTHHRWQIRVDRKIGQA